MAEPQKSDAASGNMAPHLQSDSGTTSSGVPVRLIIWALLSLAFLGYLAFGSVGARIWRFGQLQVESRSIASTWRVQGQNLPDVAHEWLIESIFYGAIVVFVVCVIVGMHLLLAESPDDRTPAGNDHS